MSSQKTYEYPALNPRIPSIRLLTLLPGEDLVEIGCQLTLSHISSGDVYDAVSYFWGSPGLDERRSDERTTIILDNQCVQVSRCPEKCIIY